MIKNSMAKVPGPLKGTTTRGYVSITESLNLFGAYSEICHNAFEHGDETAKVIKFSHQTVEGKPKIKITHNGSPMDDEIFAGFISCYHFHDTSHSSPLNGNFTSKAGYGLKDAIVFLSSKEKPTIVTISNYFKDGRKTVWKWCINQANASNGWAWDTFLETVSDLEYTSNQFEISIENARVFTDNEIKDVAKRLQRAFSQEIVSQGKSILVNTKDTKRNPLVDPFHFDEMPLPEGKTITDCEEGLYCNQKKEIVWNVRDAILKGEYQGKIKEVKVRTISLYMNGEPYNKLHPYDVAIQETMGVYPLKGLAYIEQGGNLLKHFGYAGNSGGGSPRCRFCIIITDENEFLWGTKAFKSLGIDPLINNPILDKFEIVKNKDFNGFKAYAYLDVCAKEMYQFHKRKREIFGKNQSPIENISTESICEVFNNSSNKNKSKSKQEVTVEKEPVLKDEFAEKRIYTVDRKDCPFVKRLDDNGNWEHNIRFDCINKSTYNSLTVEKVNDLWIDSMEEAGVSPDHYIKTIMIATNKINNE